VLGDAWVAIRAFDTIVALEGTFNLLSQLFLVNCLQMGFLHHHEVLLAVEILTRSSLVKLVVVEAGMLGHSLCLHRIVFNLLQVSLESFLLRQCHLVVQVSAEI